MTDIKYPTGYPSGDRIKIAVVFPPVLFNDIIAMAKKDGVTFNAMVISLCQCGQLDLEDLEREEKLESNGHPL